MRVLFCLCLLVSACATTSAGGSANVPPLALNDVDGRVHYLNEAIGQKVVVMTFWATWCMPCRQELAVLEEIYRAQRDNGLEVLAINIDGAETLAQVRPFVKVQGWTFPVLLDTETRAVALYNPNKTAPMLHIFDRNGRIVYSHTAFNPEMAAALRRKIAETLATSSR